MKHLGYTDSAQVISKEKLEAMSLPEVLAVAIDRGYGLRAGSRHAAIEQFLEKQAEDSRLHEPGSLEEVSVEPLPEANEEIETGQASPNPGTGAPMAPEPGKPVPVTSTPIDDSANPGIPANEPPKPATPLIVTPGKPVPVEQ